jgi:hypothetical protein
MLIIVRQYCDIELFDLMRKRNLPRDPGAAEMPARRLKKGGHIG